MGLLGALGGIAKGALPFLGPIGSVAGGIMDYMSQSHANQANAANVDKQIAFQKEQSETQYQRATKDMEAAGLNPALAYQQGGNTAESGAAATVAPTTSNTASKFATAIGVYNDIANGTAQRDLLRSQANAQDAQAKLAENQALATRPDALYGQSYGSGSGDNAQRYFKNKLAKLDAETYGYEHEPERFRTTLNSLIGGTAYSYAAAKEARTRATLNEQGYVNESFRRYLPYLNSAKSVIGVASGATGLMGRVQNLSQEQ
jgi:hypothetical protein